MSVAPTWRLGDRGGLRAAGVHDLREGVGRAIWPRGDLGLSPAAELRGGIPHRHLLLPIDEPVYRRLRGIALEPAAPVGGPRLRPVVALAGVVCAAGPA